MRCSDFFTKKNMHRSLQFWHKTLTFEVLKEMIFVTTKTTNHE